jgi:formylglycine-generating enzyme
MPVLDLYPTSQMRTTVALLLAASPMACGGLTSNGADAASDGPRADVARVDAMPTEGGSPDASVFDASDAADSGGANPDAAGQSCAPGGPGRTNCGPDAESCCTSLLVPGGTFFRTYDKEKIGDGGIPYVTLGPDASPTDEADPATVSSFRLDKYLVTVGRFRPFMKAWADGYRPPVGSGKHVHLNHGKGLANTEGGFEPGWLAAYDKEVDPTKFTLRCVYGVSTIRSDDDRRPINCVDWWDAYAFCIWDGGFLPSEAEWIYAAGGGDEQREYPWGSTDPGSSSEYAIYGCYYPNPASPACTSAKNLAPVGTATAGAARWGQLDMAGQVEEWLLDVHASYRSPCVDCAFAPEDLRGSDYRAEHGGAFYGLSWVAVAPYRGVSGVPDYRWISTGLRCARGP